MTAALDLARVSRHFGGVRAVHDLTFNIAEDGITGLIGPNGAGKTTLFDLITGRVKPTSGTIRFRDIVLNGRDPGDIARLGLVRSFQSPMVLAGLTVRDHLRQAALFSAIGRPRDLLRRVSLSRARQQAIARADQVLEFVGLYAQAQQQAGALAYGLQKTLGLAMAVATGPRLLLADEPAAGLNGAETHRMEALLRSLRSQLGISLIVVEHDLPMVMRLCERIIVLAQGQVVADGTPAQVRQSQAFISAYLGSHQDAA